jgi:squalene-associated FAD-dependent desaturase
MPKKQSQEKLDNSVIIVGGGWAGLAAAIELGRHKVPVIVLESAKQLGGRARSVHINKLHIDNGQHMLLGAYESTLNCLHQIGVNESDVFERQPLSLQWLRPNGNPVSLNALKLPAPLHLAWALFRAKGLSLNDRLSALKFCYCLQKINFTVEIDCDVESLLKKYHQSSEVIKAIWEPLCLGALNTQIHEASAQIFLRTLGDSFSNSRKDSDILLTKKDLGSIFPEPASDYIETHRGSVRLGERVTELNISNGAVTGVQLSEQQIKSRYIVLATPSIITNTLIEDNPDLQHVSSQLQSIRHRPICTVYLQYPENTKLDGYLRGSLDTTSQWIFDRRLYKQNGLMSVVISGEGEHMNWNNEKLCDVISEELATHFPDWPKATNCHVIREKRATFAATVGINKFRPETQSSVNGLWLAGDYTNNGLPGTLEGAIRSGLQCAQQIIIKQRSNH